MRMITLVAAILAGGLVASAATAQTAGDPNVGAALKQIGLDSCKVDDDGDYFCTLRISDTRTHGVMIYSKPIEAFGIARRRVSAVGYASGGPLSASSASALLQANSGYNFGAWEIQQSGGKTMAVLGSWIPVNATAEQLTESVALVAMAADEIEEVQTGKDEY
jgi:hypothetical protein